MGSSGLQEEEQGWRRSDVGWLDESGRREGEEEQEGFMPRDLHGQAGGRGGGVRCGFSARQDAFMCPNKRSFWSKSFLSRPLLSCLILLVMLFKQIPQLAFSATQIHCTDDRFKCFQVYSSSSSASLIADTEGQAALQNVPQ